MSFRWSQQSTSVTIIVPANPSTIKKTDVEVVATQSSLKVTVSGNSLCEGNFFAPIVPSKVRWDLGKSGVQISLEKANAKGPKWTNLFASGFVDDRKKMQAVYDYDAADPVELSMREGDVISVLKEDNSGWWKGELNGKTGLFPSNFCQEYTSTSQSPPPPAPEVQESLEPENEPEAALPPPIEEAAPSRPAGVPMPGMMIPNMNELKNKLANRTPGGGGSNAGASNPPSRPSPNPASPPGPASPVIGPGLLKKTPSVVAEPTPTPGPPPAANKPNRPTPPNTASAAVPPPVVPTPSSLKQSGGAPNKAPPATPPSENKPPAAFVPPPPPPVEPPVVKAKAIYDYAVNSETEMTLTTGDIIVIQLQGEDGWWLGDIDDANGFRSGYFPCDYVELIPDEPKVTFVDVETVIGEDLASLSSKKDRLDAPARAGGARGRRPPSRKSMVPIKVEGEKSSAPAPAAKKAAVAAPPSAAQRKGSGANGSPVAPVKASAAAPKEVPVASTEAKEVPKPLRKSPSGADAPEGKPNAAPGKIPGPSALKKAAEAPSKASEAPSKASEAPAKSELKPKAEPKLETPASPAEKQGPPANFPAELGSWEDFCSGLSSLLGEFKKSTKEKAPHVAEYGGHGEHFGLSIVSSADGRKYQTGDNHYFPVGNVSSLFVYLSALVEGNEKEVDKLTGNQFVAEENYFTPSKVPGNPFLPAGAAALIHNMKGNNDGAKVATVLSHISSASGERASCNLPTFFSLQDSATGHQLSALLHHMKGHGGLPHGVRVKKLINTLLGLYAVELDITGAATAAATLANDGVNPASGSKCFEPKFVKKAKDLLVSAGDLQDAPVLAKYGSSGVLLVILPKVAGIAVHAPSLSLAKAQDFLNKLVLKYPHLKNVK